VSLLDDITAPADVRLADSRGRSLLWWACHTGQTGVGKRLIEAGADVNAADTHFKRTPLMGCVSFFKQKDVIKALLAKGADAIALSIREMAEAQGVPVLTIPLLARALYFTSEIGSEIHSDLYRAVATVLSFVFQAAPDAELPDVEVPEQMRFDGNGRKLGATA
jgi:type III secretion system FlhB-like substrate exporter